MKIIIIGICLLLLGNLTSCKKEPTEVTTTLSGYVLTRGTNSKATSQLLPIRLYDNFSSSIFSQPSRIVDTLYTDSNGYYSHTFTTDTKFKEHHLWMITPVNLHYGMSSTLKFTLGGNIIKNIELIPYAWVKLRVKNNGPHYPGDKVVIRISNEPVTLYGPVDTEITLKGFGNGNNIVTHTVHRNLEVTQFHDTLYLSAFDTSYHNIEY